MHLQVLPASVCLVTNSMLHYVMAMKEVYVIEDLDVRPHAHQDTTSAEHATEVSLPDQAVYNSCRTSPVVCHNSVAWCAQLPCVPDKLLGRGGMQQSLGQQFITIMLTQVRLQAQLHAAAADRMLMQLSGSQTQEDAVSADQAPKCSGQGGANHSGPLQDVWRAGQP